MIIQVEVKNEYGNDRIYPVTQQRELWALTRRKTLDTRDIEALKAFGITFEDVTARKVTF